MFSRTTLSIFVLVCMAQAALAQTEKPSETDKDSAVEVVLESGAVFVVQGETRTEVELLAAALAFRLEGSDLYVALGAHGAALYDISEPGAPVLKRQVSAGREQVTGFIVVDGKVWMRVVSESAIPLDQGAPGVAQTETAEVVKSKEEKEEDPAEEKVEPKLSRSVAIVKLRPGEVKLDAGTQDGVKVGDRFSVFRTIKIEDEMDEEGSFEGRELAGVIEVVAVNEESALAEIWRGDRVTLDDELLPAEEDHESSKAFPRRLDNLAEVSFVLRPILDLENGGMGGLVDLSANYVGRAWFAGVTVQPMGFGVTERGSLFNAIGVVEGGYDGRAFAIGIGVGFSAQYGNTKAGWDGDAPDDVLHNQSWNESSAGFVVSQVFRLGPRDGLNLTGRNTLIDFEWGSAHAKFDIPVTNHSTLFIEGGGGIAGYGMGALGVSTWLKGNGDAGSLGLSVSVGGAGAWVDYSGELIQTPLPDDTDYDPEDADDADTYMIIGPMVSLGFTYRFGF